ncbi:hypothetical protein IWZ01DRAFT_137659 [Phyllosticta capitalensis]
MGWQIGSDVSSVFTTLCLLLFVLSFGTRDSTFSFFEDALMYIEGELDTTTTICLLENFVLRALSSMTRRIVRIRHISGEGVEVDRDTASHCATAPMVAPCQSGCYSRHNLKASSECAGVGLPPPESDAGWIDSRMH